MKHERVHTAYVTLHFPILNIDTNERDQFKKLVEEYNEFRKELFAESGPERMLHELQDIVQAYVTLLCQKAKPFSVDHHETAERVIDLMDEANQEHRRKMERYRAERGWN